MFLSCFCDTNSFKSKVYPDFMNKIVDSKEYKRMKEVVLRELQLKLLEAKLHDENNLLHVGLSEREIVLEGLMD